MAYMGAQECSKKERKTVEIGSNGWSNGWSKSAGKKFENDDVTTLFKKRGKKGREKTLKYDNIPSCFGVFFVSKSFKHIHARGARERIQGGVYLCPWL
jgi:hypothetical protein